MALLAQQTADEKSRTITLRVDRSTRTAKFDELASIYYGDTLIVVVDNLAGVDPASLQLWLWKNEAGQAITDRLAYAESFALVNGFSTRASKEIAFNSLNLSDALADAPLGTPVTCRLVLREGNMPIVDVDCDIYPNFFINADPQPDPEDVTANPYLRRDHLRQWALDALDPQAAGYLPLTDPDAMAAALAAILTKLSDPTA